MDRVLLLVDLKFVHFSLTFDENLEFNQILCNCQVDYLSTHSYNTELQFEYSHLKSEIVSCEYYALSHL